MSANGLSLMSSDIIERRISEFFVDKLKTSNVKIVVDAGSKHGDNFIGITYRVTGTNESNNEKLTIFVKIAPTNPDRRAMFFCRGAFLREILTYTEVS